jgi:hypothetical protein
MAENNQGCPLCASPEASREWVYDRPDMYTAWCKKCGPFLLFAILPARVWARCPVEEWARLRRGLSISVKRHWARHATPLEITGENWRALAKEGLIFFRRKTTAAWSGRRRSSRR